MPDQRHANDVILTQLTYDRCKSYVNSIQAILHLYRYDESAELRSLVNLSHILGLISLELDSLSDMLECQTSGVNIID